MPSVIAMSNVRHDGAPAPPVTVDPGQVRRSGRALARIGDELRADVERAGWALPDAGGGNPGWRAVDAATGAARQWEEMLRSLAGQFSELGDAFVAAAGAYQRCDAQAGARTGTVVPR